MIRVPALTLILAVALGGCGLRPLYGGGGHGAVAQSLRAIDVAPIGGRAGWLVRTALEDRLGGGTEDTRYRLEVTLDDQITSFGVRRDDAETRERRSLRARYRLVEVGNNAVVLDATAGSDAGIDVVSSDFATLAAEQSALERLSRDVADQIVTRLAQFASRGGASGTDGGGGTP
jgi:LPS-assembly lipoprotein